ncbi:factor-independent urate hydroxylase [Frankia sp. R82]|uniref:factor-independent urate hydroxylase n=1 Tax=Frankia sp. R82 TaxID=2950553 RepID=UPI00204410CC|nr:urate oxidase [Frankia sp. R82]MCM3884496.1 urate oxidase [Frankia sp. R82]
MAIVLGPNQFGKAEVRLVRVDRSPAVHRITDLNVSTALRGDFDAAHLVGDNSHVLTTDAQKNTVYAFAREHGIGQIEDFSLRLGRHFVDAFGWIQGARVEIEQYRWDRIVVDGAPHDHAFSRSGGERRTTVVTIDGPSSHVVSGLAGLVVLKSTGSEFHGFARDRYTTLAETTDRILATEVTAHWRYVASDLDFGPRYDRVRDALVTTFARVHSLALQQTLYRMGEAVLNAVEEVAEIRISMPNKHHFLVDLTPFGLDNPDIIYQVPDRPYGLIEATVLRDDAPDPGPSWQR